MLLVDYSIGTGVIQLGLCCKFSGDYCGGLPPDLPASRLCFIYSSNYIICSESSLTSPVDMNLTLRLAGFDFGVAYALPVWALCELFS